MNLILHLILCAVLLLATIGVAIYRKWLEDHCDHYIHLHNDPHDSGIISNQQALCQRLELMSRLQSYMIAAVIAYVVVIIAATAYAAWKAPAIAP